LVAQASAFVFFSGKPTLTSDCATTRPESAHRQPTIERRNPGCHTHELRYTSNGSGLLDFLGMIRAH
jgi:hypothetical protein